MPKKTVAPAPAPKARGDKLKVYEVESNLLQFKHETTFDAQASSYKRKGDIITSDEFQDKDFETRALESDAVRLVERMTRSEFAGWMKQRTREQAKAKVLATA